MKYKLIFCTLALTTLMFGGCGQGSSDNQNAATPSSTTEVSQSYTGAQTGSQAQSDSQQQNGSQAQSDSQQQTMISEEEAKQIALSHAGLTSDQATFIKSGIDRDNGRKNYDIEFYTQDNKEYDYEIDPYTGGILEWDMEPVYGDAF